MPKADLDDIHLLRAPSPYRPTHDMPTGSIDDYHRYLLDAPLMDTGVKIDLPIRGSLRREDAAKLYELAFHAAGDVLDIGTNHGLSASIQATALAAAGNPGQVLTIDLDQRSSEAAETSLASFGHANVRFAVGDATKVMQGLVASGARFGFAFVDHSHRYEPVRSVSALLAEVLPVGAYVAFHDFVDHRNRDPARPDFDVARGALDGLGERYDFDGTCGCMGIFHRVA